MYVRTHFERIAVLVLNGRPLASSGPLLHQDQDPCTVPWADCSIQVWNTTSDVKNPTNNKGEARFFGHCYETSRSDAFGSDLYTQTRACPVTVAPGAPYSSAYTGMRPLAVPGEYLCLEIKIFVAQFSERSRDTLRFFDANQVDVSTV
jgi:hypothetical protein